MAVDGRTLTKAEAREAALNALDKAWALIPAERPDDLPGKTNSEGVYIPDHHHFETTVWGVRVGYLGTAHRPSEAERR
ncbi:hypothetical protein JOD62_001847 [Microbacterium keratanolyticum]|nr:hypothetical protein [Microbacterium keratanolyticum]MBM7469299.1 hypothetical protein [Microbacterium keratanolyticum]